MESIRPVLINGEWRKSSGTDTFQAINPLTREPLEGCFPVSPWEEVEEALIAAEKAFVALRSVSNEDRAAFLNNYAARLEARAEELVDTASRETALPVEPRLKSVELPRTVNQLKLAANAAEKASWCLPTIDTQLNIRSMYSALGPVCVFGPNNFPFAFNGISGGDFAAAIGAGNPVIAKANPGHPDTSRLLAEEASAAAEATGMPRGIVQLLYRFSHEDGSRLAAHPLLGAIGYTGAKSPGLKLKQAADTVGTPAYLELSSINPVVILPGALKERANEIISEFSTSCLMGTGQFCTNPGLILLLAGQESDHFISEVQSKFDQAPVGTLLGPNVESQLLSGIECLKSAGAEVLAGGTSDGSKGCCVQNTLMKVTGRQFLKESELLQTEAFGNQSLVVIADDLEELRAVLSCMEGNLTGCIYSSTEGADEDHYNQIEPIIRRRVGRLLNDKMPTGVAVSEAMNHGGPFPATGHSGFTAVGIPASLIRFSALQCYDAVRSSRLPVVLQDTNPTGKTWRRIDGEWTLKDIG
ncbi:MAG TPA: aldehyde dehydrogenase (NADP(+)) [Verrucomicrobiales bacterium]|nr:aldehyde dehydrogenase (NADP(+)) [Verrucomicrobiales bacterium]